ncbi:MAG: cytochrome c oxidase subunit II [Chloroflexi bacterium]|nr:cytochrome c oxidase subunit II [Chloroflexota bacterium]
MIEASWIVPSALIPAIMLVLLLYATFSVGAHVPTHEENIDPKLVAQTAPFNNPGLFDRGNGQYDVVMVGQTWSFRPNEIRVPLGARVTFTVTSQDVIHGLRIEKSNVNIMLIPGQVGKATAHFTERGEFLLVCHEYCGVSAIPTLGHQAMYGKVIVE